MKRGVQKVQGTSQKSKFDSMVMLSLTYLRAFSSLCLHCLRSKDHNRSRKTLACYAGL